MIPCHPAWQCITRTVSSELQNIVKWISLVTHKLDIIVTDSRRRRKSCDDLQLLFDVDRGQKTTWKGEVSEELVRTTFMCVHLYWMCVCGSQTHEHGNPSNQEPDSNEFAFLTKWSWKSGDAFSGRIALSQTERGLWRGLWFACNSCVISATDLDTQFEIDLSIFPKSALLKCFFVLLFVLFPWHWASPRKFAGEQIRIMAKSHFEKLHFCCCAALSFCSNVDGYADDWHAVSLSCGYWLQSIFRMKSTCTSAHKFVLDGCCLIIGVKSKTETWHFEASKS